MLGVSQSRGLRLFGREIILRRIPTYVLLIRKRHGQADGRTERQTDRRLTVALPRSALASRGEEYSSEVAVFKMFL